MKCGLVLTDTSDHFPVFVILNLHRLHSDKIGAHYTERGRKPETIVAFRAQLINRDLKKLMLKT